MEIIKKKKKSWWKPFEFFLSLSFEKERREITLEKLGDSIHCRTWEDLNGTQTFWRGWFSSGALGHHEQQFHTVTTCVKDVFVFILHENSWSFMGWNWAEHRAIRPFPWGSWVWAVWGRNNSCFNWKWKQTPWAAPGGALCKPPLACREVKWWHNAQQTSSEHHNLWLLLTAVYVVDPQTKNSACVVLFLF